MRNSWDHDRRSLLDALRRVGSEGHAEGARSSELAPNFYPVPEHMRVLDIDAVLVVGPRGSGKSQISRVLTEAGLGSVIARYAPRVRLPTSGTGTWLKAYPAGRESFEPLGLKSFLATHDDKASAAKTVWLAYLVRLLRDRLDPESQNALSDLWKVPAADVSGVAAAFAPVATQAVVALDRLDEKLESAGDTVFVTYDELEKLGDGDWSLIAAGIQGLVALWASYTRRWSGLRAKLFLRTDLYDRHARSGGADLYKLAASRVELRWSDRDLYAMLLKRMANVDDSLSAYVRRPGSPVDWSQDPSLGWMPDLRRWDDARAVLERMVGPYMGANVKKGWTYRWILDHIRDGAGRASPRTLLKLMEEAAAIDINRSSSVGRPRILAPDALRLALDRLSGDQVTQARDEWPWLDELKETLEQQPLVPYDERELLRMFGTGPLRQDSGLPLNEREWLAYLVELGILRRRPDGRFDAPDLYQAGLGLRSKGGVSRRRQ